MNKSVADLTIGEFAQMLQPGEKLMGLDLGTKTIGVAMSDLTRSIASGRETVRRTKFSVDVVRLLALIDEEPCGGIVLGIPYNMNGTEGPRAQATRSFKRNFEQLTHLPILLWDERLSTAAVTRTLLEADASRARRAEVVDKMAAAYILQGALDRMKTLPRQV